MKQLRKHPISTFVLGKRRDFLSKFNTSTIILAVREQLTNSYKNIILLDRLFCGFVSVPAKRTDQLAKMNFAKLPWKYHLPPPPIPPLNSADCWGCSGDGGWGCVLRSEHFQSSLFGMYVSTHTQATKRV